MDIPYPNLKLPAVNFSTSWADDLKISEVFQVMVSEIHSRKKPLSVIPVTYRVVIFWRRSTGEKLSWIVTIDVESNVGRIKSRMVMHFCMNGGLGTVLTYDIFSQRRFVQDDFADMWFYASQKQPLTLFLLANLAPLPNNIK